MSNDMPAYGVTELAAEEATAVSGGNPWAIGLAVAGFIGVAGLALWSAWKARHH
ncbi:hypothetical protein ACWTU6_30025 [Mesorhizobium sp. BHbsci]